MRVRCKKILTNRPNRIDQGNQDEDLTVGNDYLVLCIYFSAICDKEAVYYQMEADSGDLIIFEADQFEVLSNYIPSNWEIEVNYFPKDDTYRLMLGPRNWNNSTIDFYEDITNASGPLENWRHYPDIPEVVKLYLQEKDIIATEEEEYQQKYGNLNRN